MVSSPALYGKYVLESPLARGGMGTVWAAFDPQLKRKVALKTMHRDALAAPSALERFEREAATLAQLQHPNVVQVFDFGVADAVPYIVMELLTGEDLARRMERVRRFPLPAFTAIFEQVARALTAAHAAGVIHRDLKPGNVFLAQSGPEEVVKLVDFGIAAPTRAATGGADEETLSSGHEPPLATRVGPVIGTPHYMSPEQSRGRPIDHRSDLWSLGVVTYQALTGQLPFSASRVEDILLAVWADPIVPPSSLVTELGPEVDRFFERALARDPAGRFQSAQEMVAAFVRLAEPDSPRPAKILVVDDEPDMPALIRQRFRRRIQDGSYSFLFAADGLLALEQLRLHPDIDAVVSDIRMPNMDGLTMLARVQEVSPLTRVILVSAFGDMTNIRQAMNRGAFDFLVKPVDYKDLQATIDKTVAHVRDARRTLRSTRENDILRMFASHDLVNNLPLSTRGGAAPEGGSTEATAAFIGIVTPSSAGARALEIANESMEIIVPEIFARGGTASRFTEDGVLALFQDRGHVERAITAALAARSEVQRRLRDAAGEPRVRVRAGIGSGTVTLGAIGSRSLRRMEYILFGDPVRTAQHLAGAAAPEQVLVEEALIAGLGGSFEALPAGAVPLPGRDAPAKVHNLAGHGPSASRPPSAQTTAVLPDEPMSSTTVRDGSTGP